ncbi:MAG TPA: alpha/beta fold hydrolase [Candidatus Limnocylindria bacterium]|nr:alpha/beta fold hydrolase [Candidatus Limnocylindria bacterium]
MGRIRTQIPVDGAALAADVIGSGRPILVLHGGPDFDDEYLLPDLDRLADLGMLVSYAQRGRGRSYAGDGAADVSLPSEMADVDAVRRWTGHERVAVLGHSFGSLLALEYAARHPDRVSHLVLVNPAPASHADLGVLRSHLARIRTPEEQERMAALRADPGYAAGDPTIDRELHALHFRPAFADPAKRDVILGRLRRSFSADAIVAARAIESRLYEDTWLQPTYDLLPRLADLRIPSLVIGGDHDFIPPEIAERIAAALPDAHLVALAQCGHFALLEQPEAVHRAAAELLAR